MQVSPRILPLPPPLSPSPILTLTTQVIIAEESEGLFRFVVYVFAIIGGGFTVFGMIDGLVYHSDRLLREKVGLGKAA